MRRFGLLMLLAILGFIHAGCNSNSSSPTTPGNSAAAYTYPFLQIIGTYDESEQNSDWWAYGCCSTPPSPVAGTYDQPTGVAVGGSYLFVADDWTGYISKFDLNGNFISSFYAHGIGDETEFPVGMATDNHGHLYVANSNYGEVDIYDFNGNWMGYLDPDYDLDCPTAVAVDANENVYVTDACDGPDGEVFKIAQTSFSNCCGDPTGTLLAYNYEGFNNILEYPTAIAVDAGGTHVYVTDTYNSVVEVYDSGLNPTGIIGTPACDFSCPTTATGQLFYPYGLTLDNDGNLLVGDTENGDGFGRIEKFSTSGTFLAEFGQNSTGNPIWTTGQLYYPTGVAVDSNSNVYVADWGWDLVFKYAPR